MKDVKVTVLRQKLPQYLARVRRGERLRVTSRGRPIAELAPVIDPGEWNANCWADKAHGK
jgi:prevent-host-death family protein